MNIRTRVNIFLFFVFFPLVAISGAALLVMSTKSLDAELREKLSIVSDSHAHDVRTVLAAQEDGVVNLAASQVMRNLLSAIGTPAYDTEKQNTRERLLRTRQVDLSISHIVLLDSNGKVITATDPSLEEKDWSGESFFRSGRENVSFQPVYRASDGTVLYGIAAPIRDDATRETKGVLFVSFDFSKTEIPKVAANRGGLGNSGEAFLINEERKFLTVSLHRESDSILRETVDTENAKSCFAPEEKERVSAEPDASGGDAATVSVQEYTDYRGVAILGTHAYIPETGWCFISKIDRAEAYAPSRSLLLFFSAMMVVLFIVFLFFSFFVSKRISDSILKLHRGVKIVEKGNLNYSVGMDEKDEIGELSHSFDNMVTVIRESRKEVDEQVRAQTAELLEKQKKLEDQQKAMVNVLDDVEAEKRKAEALAIEMSRLAAVVRDTSEAILSKDLTGVILSWNDGAANMYGYTEKEAVGKNVRELILPEEKYREVDEILEKIRRGARVEKYESVRKKKDGTLFEVEITVSPIYDGQGTIVGASVIARDITKAKEIDRAKSEFVSLASHQLRTPLSAINWYAEMLLSGDGGRIPKAAREYLEEIRHGGRRMTELVGALLNVSRIEMGTFAVSPEPTDILLLAQDVLDELKPNILEKRLHIKTKFSENLPKLSVDPKLIRIVFQNLLTNAVKYTSEEGTVSVSIRLLPEEKVFSIEVSDTGYGIPKSEQANIFTKLFRASNVREKETDGTGLGLYIVKSIVEHSGGAIRFESEEGKGTTFTLTLPLSGMERKEGTRRIEWKEAL